MSTNQRGKAHDDRPLEHALAEVEVVRRRWVRGCWLVLGAWVLLLGYSTRISAFHFYFWVLLGWLIPLFFALYAKKRYGRAYKAIVLPRLLHEIGPALRYDRDGGLPQAAFADSLYSPGSISSFATEHLIEGEFAGRPRRICEMRVLRGYGKQRTTPFHGLFSETTLARGLQGHVVVVPDVAERLLGSLGAKLQGLSMSRGEVVRFDDADFEKVFAVYAEHEEEARGLLTKRMRRKLLALRGRFGVDMGFTVRGNKAYLLAWSIGGYFQPHLTQSAVSQASLDKLEGDLRAVLEGFEALPLAELSGPELT